MSLEDVRARLSEYERRAARARRMSAVLQTKMDLGLFSISGLPGKMRPLTPDEVAIIAKVDDWAENGPL